MTVIDLDKYRSGGSRIFSGRDRGEVVRAAVKLDNLDKTATEVSVLVPLDVMSVNSSFFLGMFGESIRELGEEGFRKKYHFGGKNIESTIDDAIAEELRRVSPLRRS